MSALAELIKTAGVPVSRTPARLRDLPVTLSKERRVELEMVLHLRDGFRTADGTVLVRPSVTVGAAQGIQAWNRLSSWRNPYRKSSELLFFAETTLGHQYGLYRDEVVRFDPERGAFEHYAFKLERWAQRVLEEPDPLSTEALQVHREAGGAELETTQKLQPNRPLRCGPPEGYVVRADLDLMHRYARLFRHAQTAEERGETIDALLLDWWLVDPLPEERPLPAAEPTTGPATDPDSSPS